MHSFHIILVPTVAIMPLIMLLPKPFILRARAHSGVLEHDPADPHASEEFDFGEVFIHQGTESRVRVSCAVDAAAAPLALSRCSAVDVVVLLHCTGVATVIETIEFVLGAVSNTASYLRLWALSLAHSQLTDVFFEKVLVACLEMVKDEGGLSPALAALTMFVGFAIWISVTFGVLMVMESLSAVLHALRCASTHCIYGYI